MSGLEGIDRLLDKLEKIADVDDAVLKIMDDCGQLVQNQARLNVPVDTGDLRKSIQKETETGNGQIVSTVYTNSDHAEPVEFGSGPVGAAHHEGISPNVAPIYAPKAWRGVIPDMGVRYIRGQPAQPYLYPALKENEGQIEKYICEKLTDLIRERTT